MNQNGAALYLTLHESSGTNLSCSLSRSFLYTRVLLIQRKYIS